MTLEQWMLSVIVVVPFIFVGLNRLRIDLAALLIAALLGLGQFLGLALLGPANTPAAAIKAISGFSEPVVITLLSLFILTRALDRSGVTRWIARRLIRLGGQSERKLIGLFAASSALLSLFMNNLAAGAL